MGDFVNGFHTSPVPSGAKPSPGLRKSGFAAPKPVASSSRTGVSDRAELSLIPAESAIVAPARSDAPPKLDRAAMNRAIQNYDRDGSGMDSRVAETLRRAPERFPAL